MKNKIGKYLIAFALGMALMFMLKNCGGTEIIEVPVRIEVPVPVVEKVFDTIIKPEPIYVESTKIVLDTSLVDNYRKANDSLKIALFNSAVTKRDYKEVFEDSIQTIEVSANVTGTLNSLQTSYKTKERTVLLDTVIDVEVPKKPRAITPYMEVGSPTNLPDNLDIAVQGVVLKGGLDYKTRKNWVYGASYDTNKRFWIKVGKSFDF